jgi:GWxTD domain-containing protein
MTPDERVDVEREIARARKEIEAARGEIEREARVALREAQRELEKERPKIEAEIRAALAEVKSLEGKQISEEVRKSVEAALAQLDSTQFQKGVVEAALRSSEEALKASAAALAQVEKNLAESRRASAAASSAAAVAPAAAPTPAAAPAAAETERERRVRYADNKWTKGATKGSETAKGRAYLQYGPPDEIEVTPSKIEKWHYRARAGQAERFVEFDADGKKVKDELVK